jgi:hypothetical protein
MRVETKRMVDCGEWDALVQQTYGRPYCFQQQDGCKMRGTECLTVPDTDDDLAYENDTLKVGEVGVSFSAWLSRDPNLPLEGSEYDWQTTMWWERDFYPHVQAVANDLHARGLLEAGEYVINIDW